MQSSAQSIGTLADMIQSTRFTVSAYNPNVHYSKKQAVAETGIVPVRQLSARRNDRYRTGGSASATDLRMKF